MRRVAKRILNFLNMLRNSRKCKISIGAWVRGRCEFEGYNRICGNTIFVSSKIGYGSYIGSNGNFTRVKIGKYCSIGSGVAVISGTHPVHFVSTHPAFCSKDYKPYSYAIENYISENLVTENGYQCEIGNDVWIGNNVLIRGGVKIGNGAIIGMGAVITKDIPPYAIVGGVPAKIIKYRFDNETIAKLQKVEWWNQDEKWLRTNAALFTNVDTFIEVICHENM